jgi:pimeloyl-ACP methyl ester carboxylesterase
MTVHGLWMTGVETAFLRRRLRDQYGYATSTFHYRTVRATLSENAARLRESIIERFPDLSVPLHLVGHSLGGLVVFRMLRDWPDAPPGRIVCLGSPLNGSAAALRIATLPGGSSLLGKSIREGVLERSPAEWLPQLPGRDVGAIAGTMGFGLGRMVADLPQPNDGTVTVAETRWAGLCDHMTLAASHTGLILSREVADQVASFLASGRFRHAPRDE